MVHLSVGVGIVLDTYLSPYEDQRYEGSLNNQLSKYYTALLPCQKIFCFCELTSCE